MKVRKPSPHTQKVRNSFRLEVERLEDRCLLSFGLYGGPNVNISRWVDNQAEGTITINPSNPLWLFAASVTYGAGGTGLFAGYSTDGGTTWTGRNMATGKPGGDSLPAAWGDPSAAFDQFGNLFLTYMVHNRTQAPAQEGQSTGENINTPLNDTTRDWAPDMWANYTVEIYEGTGIGQSARIRGNAATQLQLDVGWPEPLPDNTSKYRIVSPEESIVVAMSTDGGRNFRFLKTVRHKTGVDYPSIATGPGGFYAPESVWVSWVNYADGGVDNRSGIWVTGAPVIGPGLVGAFTAARKVEDSDNGVWGDLDVGPTGQVLVTWQRDATIKANTDPDGLGEADFAVTSFEVSQTRLLEGTQIPAQHKRFISANPGVAWDRSGLIIPGNNGRVHIVYTDAPALGSADTDIYMRYSTDAGATWSPARRINTQSAKSQFLPAVAVDQTTGYVAATWYDARSSLWNTKTRILGTISTDGGHTFLVNRILSRPWSEAGEVDRLDRGRSTGGNAATTLRDTTKNWVAGQWVQQQVRIEGGRGAGQVRTITANTNTQLTVDRAWDVVPDETSYYKIEGGYTLGLGDYTGLAFHQNSFYPGWADNSGSTLDNPDGKLELYTVQVMVLENLPPPRVATSAPDAGTEPLVSVFDADTGEELYSFAAFDPSFTGGVRVAAGDVNGDGRADIIAGTGAGGLPQVKVFSGLDSSLLLSLLAYESGFTGGVYVAAGDIDGDGKADIITGAGVGRAPEVRVFRGTDGALIHSFLAYDSSFQGGVRVAARDVSGDGIADIIAGKGSGSGPELAIFDGLTLAALDHFFAYDAVFGGGLFVG